MSTKPTLFRPWLPGAPWVLATLLFVVHAAVRFGGMHLAVLTPLSMVLVWPLPWLLASHTGRRRLGFRAPTSWIWLVMGPAVAVGALAVCVAVAWLVFGTGSSNWFVQHGHSLGEILARVPPDLSPMARFWMVTGPALVFSPFAEEFLYRGFILTTFAERWGERIGQAAQASAFAFVHLAHYGLMPFQPSLIVVWVPSMFMAAWVFGGVVRRSGSVWPAVLAHAVFNLGMNAVVFAWLPSTVGG